MRNLSQLPQFAFWLPTATDNFYPDFVVELLDGRVAVVEYKGKHLRDEAGEIEKRAVGRLWSKKSGGEHPFDFVFKKGDGGETLTAQLNSLFGT